MEFPCNVSALLHALFSMSALPMLGKYSFAVTEKVLTAEVAAPKLLSEVELNQFKTSTYAARVRSLTSMIFGHGG